MAVLWSALAAAAAAVVRLVAGVYFGPLGLALAQALAPLRLFCPQIMVLGCGRVVQDDVSVSASHWSLSNFLRIELRIGSLVVNSSEFQIH